jgi:hypothetical protein
MRDLFIRHDRLSVDQVDRLKALDCPGRRQGRLGRRRSGQDREFGVEEEKKATTSSRRSSIGECLFPRDDLLPVSFSESSECQGGWSTAIGGISCASCYTTGRTRSSFDSCDRLLVGLLTPSQRTGRRWYKGWMICDRFCQQHDAMTSLVVTSREFSVSIVLVQNY